MSEGYCVKCKAKKPIADGVEETMKNGRKAIKGKCPTCGTVMFKILGKAAAAAAPVRTDSQSQPQSPAASLILCPNSSLTSSLPLIRFINPAPAAF